MKKLMLSLTVVLMALGAYAGPNSYEYVYPIYAFGHGVDREAAYEYTKERHDKMAEDFTAKCLAAEGGSNPIVNKYPVWENCVHISERMWRCDIRGGVWCTVRWDDED